MSTNQPFGQTHFIEEMGLMFELVGLPRMAGRIFGWLLISDPPQQSSGELVTVLQASKGSISTMTRLLIQIGLLERVSLLGQRQDYFQIRPNAWEQLMEQRMSQLTAFRELAERGLTLMADQSSDLRQRLEEMRDVHAFWETEVPHLHQRWVESQLSSRMSNQMSNQISKRS